MTTKPTKNGAHFVRRNQNSEIRIQKLISTQYASYSEGRLPISEF